MRNNITSTQWFSVLAASLSAILMMNYVRMFVTEVGRGTYLSALLLALFTGILLFIILALEKANDFRSPTETISSLLGSIPTKIILCLTVLGFFLYAVETLNIYVYIVKFYFLPRTPSLFLATALFLPAIYTAYCGFRTFGSVASVSLTFFALFLLMFFFTKNNYLPSNLMPWNEFQWTDILSSLPFLFLSAPALAASFFILPYCRDHRQMGRKTILFTLIFAFLLIFLYFTGMAYFGEQTIQRLILPFYNLSPFFKGNLLERFDIFYMLALLPTISIFNSFGFSVCILIQEELLIKCNTKHRGLTVFLFVTAIVTLSSFTMDRIPMWTAYQYSNLIALIFCGIFLFLYSGAVIKKRRKIS